MKTAARSLLYLWSLPYGLIGLLAALLFWALRWIQIGGWKDGALELVCKGPFARWMGRDREVTLADGSKEIRFWSGFTLAWTIFFWRVPDEQLRIHEHRHVEHGLWLSLLFPVLWSACTALRGYHDNPFERDARRAARQD